MRQKMDPTLRAKQFMPFAALKGYEAALRQKERVVHPPIQLGEDAQEELDHTLRQLRPGDRVAAVYYEKGDYLERTGLVSRIDTDGKRLWVAGTPIPFSSLGRLTRLQQD